MDTPVADQAADFIRLFESFSPTPYQDIRGIWTIGYGTTIDSGGRPVVCATPAITPDQATALLKRDIGTTISRVVAMLPPRAPVCQQVALVSFAYNVGCTAYQRSNVHAAMIGHTPALVPAKLRMWNFTGGYPALGLTRRRWAESAVFLGMPAQQAYDTAWRSITFDDEWPALPPYAGNGGGNRAT